LACFFFLPALKELLSFSPIAQKFFTLPVFVCIFINETNWALMGISFPLLFPGKLIPFFCSSALFVSRIPGPVIPIINDFMRNNLGLSPFIWVGAINVTMFLICRYCVKPLDEVKIQEGKPQAAEKSFKNFIKSPFEILNKLFKI